MRYVYIVRCADGTLYTGTAKDLGARVKAHNQARGARYTRGRCPVALVYAEECATPGAALRREHAIKRLTRAQKEALLEERSGRISVFAYGKGGQSPFPDPRKGDCPPFPRGGKN